MIVSAPWKAAVVANIFILIKGTGESEQSGLVNKSVSMTPIPRASKRCRKRSFTHNFLSCGAAPETWTRVTLKCTYAEVNI